MRLVYLSVLIALNSFSQSESKYVISMPNSNVVFTGYDNLIEVSSNTRRIKRIKLECESCDSIQRIAKTNRWIIRVDSIKPVLIQVKDKSGQVLDELNLLIASPPKPFLQLNNRFAFEKVSELPSEIALKIYGPIPLTIGFMIKRWSFEVGDEVFKGVGRFLSYDLQEALTNLHSGIVTVNIVYMDPFGEKELTEYIYFDLP